MAETTRAITYMPHRTPKGYTHSSGLSFPVRGLEAQTFLLPLLKMGTSGTKIHIKTTTIPLFEIQATTALTSGTQRAMQVVFTPTSVSGFTGRAIFAELNIDVVGGAYFNAIKAYTTFGTTGRTTGLASSINAEMNLPNSAAPTGHYFPVEINLIGQASSGAFIKHGFITCRTSGTRTNINGNGLFFDVEGLTAAAGAMLSLTSQTLKCNVATTEVLRYLVLSQMEDGLGLGISGTPMDLGTSVTKRAVDIYTKSASTTGGTTMKPFYVYTELEAGFTGSGGRAEFHTKAINGSISTQWSNALKAYYEFDSSTTTVARGAGKTSAMNCELKLPNTNIGAGVYTTLEVNLIGQASSGHGAGTSFINLHAGGTTTDIDDSCFLFDIDGVARADNHMCDDSATDIDFVADIVLRIRVDGVTYYLGACDKPEGTA